MQRHTCSRREKLPKMLLSFDFKGSSLPFLLLMHLVVFLSATPSTRNPWSPICLYQKTERLIYKAMMQAKHVEVLKLSLVFHHFSCVPMYSLSLSQMQHYCPAFRQLALPKMNHLGNLHHTVYKHSLFGDLITNLHYLSISTQARWSLWVPSNAGYSTLLYVPVGLEGLEPVETLQNTP